MKHWVPNEKCSSRWALGILVHSFAQSPNGCWATPTAQQLDWALGILVRLFAQLPNAQWIMVDKFDWALGVLVIYSAQLPNQALGVGRPTTNAQTDRLGVG